MDGTLTVACHDFDDIRRQMGLPLGKPILEELEKYPKDQADALHGQLYDIEMEIAHQAVSQPGAETLLQLLHNRGHQIGILTRNSLDIAFATLNACGLSQYFDEKNILGRECCAPKPDPQGVLQLIERWQCNAEQTVMVGDYLYDLQSGHSAGTYTIHFDAIGIQSWPGVTHYRINGFDEITHNLLNYT